MIERAVENLRQRQEPDGHWAGDYGGPLFLMPGLIIACYITRTELSEHKRSRMLTYLRNVQNEDGGFGLHIEDESTVFGTALNYVAMRLLGLGPDDEACIRARDRLRALGGAAYIPTWGKFWLATLGVYRWEGINPLPPELYLLPRKLPVHPSNFWCHTRQVFLPMSYIYARRLSGPETELVRALRDELFVEPWDQIDWPKLRTQVAEVDAYSPPTRVLKVMNRALGLHERSPLKPLRKRALRMVSDHMHHEDKSTGYLTIGPVSKAIQMLAVWFEAPESEAFKKHVERIEDYLWDGTDGMKMQGYNGSQLWDTAFAMLAILESGLPEQGEHLDVLSHAHNFVDHNQVKENVPDGRRYFRDPIKGAWPFSTAEQSWTVSDCTAEGLKASLLCAPLMERPIPQERLRDAVDILLGSQNKDGGWSEYEASRGKKWLELLNAAEVFGDIMIGYSYTECTSACIQALLTYKKRDALYRARDIERAVARGLDFIRARQREDGSWYGGWGICFTYGTWFGIDALVTAGRPMDQARVRSAARFLMSKQREDGSFAESHRASVEKRWIDGERPMPVQTAWALLGMLKALEIDPGDTVLRAAIDRAADFLMRTQQKGGDWAQDDISGVFNRNCMIHYDNYRHVMPLWALSRYFRACS